MGICIDRVNSLLEQKVIWHEKHWELTRPLQCTLRICIFLFSLLVRMRPLYHIPETDSNDTKHDCEYHLHSCRTLYSTIDLSE